MAGVSASLEAARLAVVRFFAEEGDKERDRVVMSRALGSLFVAGAVVGLVSLVLPHASTANVAGIAGLCVLALALGGAFAFERGRLPNWAFPAACYVATLAIAAALYFCDRADSPYAFFFVVVVMFAAYFLSVRQLALQIAFVAIVYPVTIAVLGATDEQPEQRWLLTIWTLIVV